MDRVLMLLSISACPPEPVGCYTGVLHQRQWWVDRGGLVGCWIHRPENRFPDDARLQRPGAPRRSWGCAG